MAERRAAEHGPNPNTPEKAEEARQDRPRVKQDDGTVRVRAVVPVSGPDGKAHDEGDTFSAPRASVGQAIARGLVEDITEAKEGGK